MQKINETSIYSNFNRQNKFLGIIDYKTLVILLIYIVVIGYLCKILPVILEFKIYTFMFLVVPVVALTLVNMNNESVIDMFVIILKYYHLKAIFTNKSQICNFKKCVYVNQSKLNK